MTKKVTIEVDAGDAIAAYVFLRSSVHRLVTLVAEMPAEKQEGYLDQPKRWDRVAIALGEAVDEVDLPSFFPEEENNG